MKRQHPGLLGGLFNFNMFNSHLPLAAEMISALPMALATVRSGPGVKSIHALHRKIAARNRSRYPVPHQSTREMARRRRHRRIEFSIGGPMISASSDAGQRKYDLLTGKKGRRWVVAIQENAAENIYADGGKGSEGMAGRTLTFPLIDGSTVDFIGPWKTSAEALFEDTGVDVRDTYLTQGIVSRKRKRGKGLHSDIYTDILHFDNEPVRGSFSRIKEIGQEFADDLGETVFVSYTSKGGGSAGYAKPRAAASG